MTELANIKRDSNKRTDQGIRDVQAGASGQVGQENLTSGRHAY